MVNDDWPMAHEQLARVVVHKLESGVDRVWPRVRWDAEDQTVINDIRLRMTSSHLSDFYIEGQVHGGVRLADVDEFRAQLRSRNPAPALAAARDAGIPARAITADSMSHTGWPTPPSSAREWLA
ncbi:MAG: hypothetical protein JWO69_1040 [Thermoleophilia bacterium]|nr:hypothetical protein [Thermoleophilia bacterium]